MFGDRFTGWGTFGGEFRARAAIVINGDFTAYMRLRCLDAALFPNYFGKLATILLLNTSLLRLTEKKQKIQLYRAEQKNHDFYVQRQPCRYSN